MTNASSCMSLESNYSALPIYRDHFTPNNLRKTPIARPLGPKFYIQSRGVLCIIVLYCTAIYRESKVSSEIAMLYIINGIALPGMTFDSSAFNDHVCFFLLHVII